MSGHHYKVGDRVRVMNQTFGGRDIVEGWAIIKRVLVEDDLYMVEFDGVFSDGLYARRVTPAMQSQASEIWS
jgi:hypothetical protein